MKQAIKNIIMIGFFATLSACNSGGGGDGQKVAEVPPAQSVITASGNPNVYCQVGQGSLTCVSKNLNGSELCRIGPEVYTDVPSLCEKIRMLRQNQYQSNPGCNVSLALDAVYQQQNCANIAVQPGSPGTLPGTTPWTPGAQRTIVCEVTGQNGDFVIVPVKVPFPVGNGGAEYDITNKVSYRDHWRTRLGDLGEFGTTKLKFIPGGRSGSGFSDIVTLSNSGFGRRLMTSQTGFAGEEVRLELRNDKTNANLLLTCKGQGGFKKNLPMKPQTQFVCKGRSSLLEAGGRDEKINLSRPFNVDLANGDIQLAAGLTLRVIADNASGDNAQIQYLATGVGHVHSVESSSYLKTQSTFTARNAGRMVDVTCGPQ